MYIVDLNTHTTKYLNQRRFLVTNYKTNRPFPNYQRESSDMKMKFIHMRIKLIFIEWLRTRPRFDTEAWVNSEMDY